MAGIFAVEHGPADALRVVLVHGSLDRSAAFARMARLLTDLAVVRYDRRGYARSLAAGTCTDVGCQVDDLAGVVGDRPAVLFGHSLGGVVALAFAARHPDLVPAVVAYEAPMAWASWWPTATAGAAAMRAGGDPADAAEQFMRRLIGDERWLALPERTRRQRRAEGPALVAELRSIRPPAPAPYSPQDLTMPVLAAHGDASAAHHVATARALAAEAPRGELVVVPGAGHAVHLSHPAAAADLVRQAVALVRG